MLHADDRRGIGVAVWVFVFSVLLKAHDLDAISVSCEFLAVRHMDIGTPTAGMETRICTLQWQLGGESALTTSLFQ